ncbi:MAG TPA: hypothetical protein VHS06_06150 [Chloroflexota bacterium]|nr:hypothetical protein [Chloroflexota bacterium]
MDSDTKIDPFLMLSSGPIITEHSFASNRSPAGFEAIAAFLGWSSTAAAYSSHGRTRREFLKVQEEFGGIDIIITTDALYPISDMTYPMPE